MNVRLEEVLELDDADTRALYSSLQGALPQAQLEMMQAPFDAPFGALFDADTDGDLLSDPGLADPPSSFDLVAEMPEIWNQMARGTCVSFAATAANQWYQRRRGLNDDLSQQHLYYLCKASDGFPNRPGTTLKTVARCLSEVGQCRASTWPYNPNSVPGNEGQGPPPGPAEAEAGRYRVAAAAGVEETDLRLVKQLLAGFTIHGTAVQGRPLVFGVATHASFQGGETRRTCKVLMPLPGEERTGGHAMVFVGYRDGAGPGGGYFIIRNSWGPGWGTENEFGPGHGLLPYAYVREFARGRVWGFFDAREAQLLEAPQEAKSAPKSNGGALLGTRLPDGGPFRYPLKSLDKHVVCIGGTGSGKTALSKLLCQKALLSGIPVIAVDPQGDIANMLEMIPRAEAKRHGLDLGEWDDLKQNVETVVFSPSSEVAIPICANPFDSSISDVSRQGEVQLSNYLGLVAKLVLEHLKLPRSKDTVYQAALVKVIRYGLRSRKLSSITDLGDILHALPPEVEAEVGKVLDPAEIHKLRKQLNAVLTLDRHLFDLGVPLNIDLLTGRLANPTGKVRLSVIYLNTLGTIEDREYFVTLLAENLYAWAQRTAPETDSGLRALLFIDELGRYVPNQSKKQPPCKPILLRMFKEARKYGVGLVGASQSPADFDYGVLAQANTVFVGRLRQPQEHEKVAPWFRAAGVEDHARELIGMKPGEFFMLAPDVGAAAERFQADRPLYPIEKKRILVADDLRRLVSDRQRQRFDRWVNER